MADHTKDKPAKPRLQSAPGWSADKGAHPAAPTPQRLKPSAAKPPPVKFPIPSFPRLNAKALTGTAAVMAALSLSVLFTRYAGNDNDTHTAPRAAQTPVAQTTEAPTPEAPPPEKKDKFSTLAQLPPPGAATEQDIKRLMKDSKLPRDVVEESLHIYNHATPGDYRGQPDDKLEVVYSQERDVLFARIHAQNTVRDIYGFEDRFGNFGFYGEDGRRIDRTTMSSPLKNNDIHNPRLTRIFDTYRHPIKKVTRHHNGIDFPAARGTPVHAIADGVVDYAKRRSGYGNTVTLRHNDSIQSLYAHLDGFTDIKAGQRVQKGEIIGYVGSTGWSTGPHLHFEIRKNGKPVNPRTITAFSAPMVGPQDVSEFAKAVTRIKNHLTTDIKHDRNNDLASFQPR